MTDYFRARTCVQAAGGRLDVVERTGSTNADLVAAARAGDLPHFSVRVTTDQTAGRGRLDRTWTAPAGTALAISVLLRTDAVPPSARGWIPLVAGVAMARAIDAQLGSAGHAVRLKWPNDVLVDGRKICGILAEALPIGGVGGGGSGWRSAVVVGAGVNTRMPREVLPVETATSFADVDGVADEDRLMADYLDGLSRRWAVLEGATTGIRADDRADVHADIRAEVEGLTATVGAVVRVSLPDARTLVGLARGLDDEGRLVVESDGALIAVSAGDVVHVRPASP
jgi:BirA family biotin operon repressor/biotin-[acetyl-CoA-carboxylase] ligase